MNWRNKLKSKICFCAYNYSSINCKKITIDRVDLDLCLEKHASDYEKRKRWHLPLTLFFTLTLALLTTKFEAEVVVPFTSHSLAIPENISIVAWTINVIFLLWGLLRIVQSIRIFRTDEIFLANLHCRILNVPDFTRVFIIKNEMDDDVKLLVEKKVSWDCFFLPYVKKEITEKDFLDTASIKKAISDKIGLNDNVTNIDFIQGLSLISEKYDPPQKVVKEFKFEFYCLTTSVKLDEVEFLVGNRKYFWKSLNDLESDTLTFKNNKDILSHLREYYAELVVDVESYHAS